MVLSIITDSMGLNIDLKVHETPVKVLIKGLHSEIDNYRV